MVPHPIPSYTNVIPFVIERQNEGLTTTKEDDLFDIELEDAAKDAKRARTEGGKPNPKRAKKNAKYGFGGKKRHAKSGDAISSGDMSGFSQKRMKEGKSAGRPGANKTKRLGKSKRAQKKF